MKRFPELRRLSDDHHQGLVLARRARQTAAGTGGHSVEGVWAEVARRFRAEFEPHFRVEETTLAPALSAAGEAELVAKLHADHAALRALVAAQAGRDGLKEFGDRMEQHIRFEERELFEAAQAKLSPEVLSKIREACDHHQG